VIQEGVGAIVDTAEVNHQEQQYSSTNVAQKRQLAASSQAKANQLKVQYDAAQRTYEKEMAEAKARRDSTPLGAYGYEVDKKNAEAKLRSAQLAQQQAQYDADKYTFMANQQASGQGFAPYRPEPGKTQRPGEPTPACLTRLSSPHSPPHHHHHHVENRSTGASH